MMCSGVQVTGSSLYGKPIHDMLALKSRLSALPRGRLDDAEALALNLVRSAKLVQAIGTAVFSTHLKRDETG